MTNNNSKRIIFLNSCKAEYERLLNCLSGQSENDIEFNELSRLIKSTSKLLSCNFYRMLHSSVPQTTKNSLIFLKKLAYSYIFC